MNSSRLTISIVIRLLILFIMAFARPGATRIDGSGVATVSANPTIRSANSVIPATLPSFPW